MSARIYPNIDGKQRRISCWAQPHVWRMLGAVRLMTGRKAGDLVNNALEAYLTTYLKQLRTAEKGLRLNHTVKEGFELMDREIAEDPTL